MNRTTSLRLGKQEWKVEQLVEEGWGENVSEVIRNALARYYEWTRAEMATVEREYERVKGEKGE